ncbi:hypothetical protein PLICRDRAFT_49137 [Plicaturopsis crispa FD-325 SS-3]|nr:hypothetical protein PLICRDRAFT_49137 [Plicaturopsis crispa FD-325 SS-3]
MQSSDGSHPFLGFYREPEVPRSRQSSASSIWAPQPQPSETTWPKAISSFARDAERQLERLPALGPEALRLTPLPPVSREDVFGPVGYVERVEQKPIVGAIGDGRKKNSPELEELHVESLLRTLNLNSPTPYEQPSARQLSLDTSHPSPGSPDFSPLSTTSSLLTPKDASPACSFDSKYNNNSPYEYTRALPQHAQPGLLFQPSSPDEQHDILSFQPSTAQNYRNYPQQPSFLSAPPLPSVPFPFFEPATPAPAPPPTLYATAPSPARLQRAPPGVWRQAPPQSQPSAADWLRAEERPAMLDSSAYSSGVVVSDDRLRSSPPRHSFEHRGSGASPDRSHSQHEPINFLSLLHPSSSPPYQVFVARIIKSSDQQASIFLQQKLKVADVEERAKIVEAICARGFEMMAHRFGNWAVQRCLEAAATPKERRQIVGCMSGRIVELATNCYGCHVLQKALDCEEDVRLMIVSELLLGDPAQTLVNKHASHVWSKIMELTWSAPAPPIFAYVNKSLKGKWASLACHETGSLVVQHAFENLEESAKDGIVDELLDQGPAVFGEVAKNQWGSYCIQHILEHGSDKHRAMTLEHLVSGLLDYSTNEQGAKSVTKALKEGGKGTLDRIVTRMCEPAKSARRAMIVDLALSVTGSQLIASVLPSADKDQRALLYDCIRGHIVTLRGCKTGSKVIWLFDRMVRPSDPVDSRARR